MSLKKKESQSSGGLRVAADDPHLVSLGGGRLSTAVTIHNIPIGDFKIGSAPDCGIVMNGTGVQPLHCTVYRNEVGDVTILPESGARTQIDGNLIDEETNLTQGAMLTIGKSNYLRFNNPAEAEFIKSTMGSNERISMPQIDFAQNSNGSPNGSAEDVLKNLTSFYEAQTSANKLTNKLDYSNINNYHSPKVFTVGSTCVNTPAKDVLGKNFNNFTKNITQNSINYTQNNVNDKAKPNNVTQRPNNSVLTNGHGGDERHVLTKVNNFSSNGSSPPTHKLQPPSPLYDRYPKPGAYGSMKIYPINGLSSPTNVQPDNGLTDDQLRERQKAELQNEEEHKAQEQARLEEILNMCAEFERQNSNPTPTRRPPLTHSPIVQNRIKTNGSLTRDKKPLGEYSPLYTPEKTSKQNVFFPDDVNRSSSPSSQSSRKSAPTSTGYENVKIGLNGRVEITPIVKPPPSNGYENVAPKNGGFMPQSPRTRIKTCPSLSPSPAARKEIPVNQKNDYDMIIQCFEEKLKQEIKQLQETSYGEVAPYRKSTTSSHENGPTETEGLQNGSEEPVDVKEKSLEVLQSDRNEILAKIRELKTKLSDLQRQEDEVMRELEMEKSLVTAELTSESSSLIDMERNLVTLQNQIHRHETQRNANRVMQETQQAKLRQNIDGKRDQIGRLETVIMKTVDNTTLKEEMDKTSDSLENDIKQLEDLEFQYLEEEADWLAYKEELYSDFKTLKNAIDQKYKDISKLEQQRSANQSSACTDTKVLEQTIFTLLQDLEKSREQLKAVDQQLAERGELQSAVAEPSVGDAATTNSDSEEEAMDRNKANQFMSQSLFGSHEIFASKAKMDFMSMSVNENMFFNTIEMPTRVEQPFNSSTPKRESEAKKPVVKLPTSNSSSKSATPECKETSSFLFKRSMENVSDPMLKLKYNLSPTYENSTVEDEAGDERLAAAVVKLNLSLNGDEFEVNPLEKRVPSQDDIDRISKVTMDAPISTQGASYKVKESIKEIERNRQLLLAQQGSSVIEHERQRVNDLKKRSHDEARAIYMKIRTDSGADFDSASDSKENRTEGDASTETSTVASAIAATTTATSTTSSLGTNSSIGSTVTKYEKPLTGTSTLPRKENKSLSSAYSPQRHSHPELDFHVQEQQEQQEKQQQQQQQQSPPNQPRSALTKSLPLNQQKLFYTRPVSDANSESSFDGHLADKPYKSNNDVRMTTMRITEIEEDIDDKRNSIASDSGNSGRLSVVRRQLPKHQRPLTRYLPIMSSDLDLRQHIETAGHQIALCPHVTVDSTSCRGYLHKLGATFRGWSRRWFVLDRNKRAFIYYADKSEKKPRGGAYFSTIDEVYLDHLNSSKSGRPHSTLIVKTKKRSYHLQAPNDQCARIWIDAIITGAQGNLDYQ